MRRGAGAGKRGAERLTPMKTPVACALLSSPVVILLALAGPAAAASPAYCALYAREYAGARIGAPVTNDDASALQRIEDQAYYRCLNQDEAPQFPTTSAYFGAPLDDITGAGTHTGGPFQALQIHPAAKTVESSADSGTTPAAARGVQVAMASPGHGHGAVGSVQWVSWCKAHYRSFDTATGSVLTFSGEKKQCP